MYKLGYGLNEWDQKCAVFEYRDSEKYGMFRGREREGKRIWLNLRALKLRLYWRREQEMNINQEETAIAGLYKYKAEKRLRKPEGKVNILTMPRHG